MIVIGSARIEEQVAHVKFACDLIACKGACCTLPGGRGAPLADNEITELEKVFPVVKKYLSEENLKVIEQNGMYEGVPGSWATTCVNRCDCVFVYYENNIAKCSIERAFNNGEVSWRKPISCHLFPIRVSPAPRSIIRYEKIQECHAALERGKAEDIPLSEFLKEPLIRAFGEQWYDEFKYACNQMNTEP